MTPLVIGIDPGTSSSAYVAFDGADVVEHEITSNVNVALYLRKLRERGPFSEVPFDHYPEAPAVVFESVESYGMTVGREIFQTIFWTGRLFQIARDTIGPTHVSRLPRRSVKKHLCRSNAVKDKHIRAALVKRFDSLKLSSHEWSALAIAVTWWDLERPRQALKG